MRITFIMVKFDLKSSTSNDFLLKSRILKELGHDITVITTFSHKNHIPDNLPFKLYEENIKNTSLLSLQIFAVNLLKKYANQTDVFYLSSDTFAFGGGFYRKFVKGSKPVVMYFNGYMDFVEPYFKKYPLWPKNYLKATYTFRNRIRFLIEKTVGVWLMNMLDKLFVMSKTVANYHIQAGLDKNKVVIMTDFYDLDFLTIKSKLANPFIDYSKNTIHFLFTGRIYIDKGLDILISAFQKLNHLNGCILHIVGDGEMKAELEELVRNNKLDNKIIFHGWKSQEEIVPFYQNADIYIQSSRLPEPINRVSVEAMANGLPLIVTSTSGEKWINSVAETFENGSVESLKNAMEKLVRNKEIRIEKSCNAKTQSLAFDYRKLGQELSNILQNLSN